MILDLDK